MKKTLLFAALGIGGTLLAIQHFNSRSLQGKLDDSFLAKANQFGAHSHDDEINDRFRYQANRVAAIPEESLDQSNALEYASLSNISGEGEFTIPLKDSKNYVVILYKVDSFTRYVEKVAVIGIVYRGRTLSMIPGELRNADLGTLSRVERFALSNQEFSLNENYASFDSEEIDYKSSRLFAPTFKFASSDSLFKIPFPALLPTAALSQ